MLYYVLFSVLFQCSCNDTHLLHVYSIMPTLTHSLWFCEQSTMLPVIYYNLEFITFIHQFIASISKLCSTSHWVTTWKQLCSLSELASTKQTVPQLSYLLENPTFSTKTKLGEQVTLNNTLSLFTINQWPIVTTSQDALGCLWWCKLEQSWKEGNHLYWFHAMSEQISTKFIQL